ncbi:CBS domain-containing membrane protein [Herbaspirillum sp. Sphag1AN]|uniref:HPP family protein n=1 Tax=unclassified Herbaspirillum TaxID=2624150 RepID=UPI00161860A0|nr:MULTISPECIES: HPP family protein [unclassified Herbaspirillum]MBB3211813.1 CBS domain-containing membrane protein [Herbaspirillum sp. Sphag1AN]MBB3244353.1 CBS domain-containing membrane protein [Herbaspirillum sp. Sphag64]
MKDSLQHWLYGFVPQQSPVDRFERMRACAGALFGILLTGLISHVALPRDLAMFWLVAPMGASAVLLFAVPASPLAQPWSIIGGNLCAALIGVSCSKLVGEPVLAAALAIALAIGAMFFLRCVHPPSGAVALTAVLGGPAVQRLGYGFVLTPVLLNSFVLLLTALLFNNATKRRYPHLAADHRAHVVSDQVSNAPTSTPGGGFTHADLDAVLRRYNQLLDISRDDLEDILRQTELEAYRRRFGEAVCADIMSEDVIAVEFGTELATAWELLRQHRLQILVVVDRARHVIGMVTVNDFLRHAEISGKRNMGDKLRTLLRRTGHTHSEKAEVVGQVMTRHVKPVAAQEPMAQLIPRMSDGGMQSVPVVDADGRLIGIVTQSAMVAALYAGAMTDGAAPVTPISVAVSVS